MSAVLFRDRGHFFTRSGRSAKESPPPLSAYLWKKNLMHQQNTGTSRMTT